VTGESELLKEIISALESEGGEATLDRLLYAYAELKEAGREKILEVAKKPTVDAEPACRRV